jgi:hypothetical protein
VAINWQQQRGTMVAVNRVTTCRRWSAGGGMYRCSGANTMVVWNHPDLTISAGRL